MSGYNGFSMSNNAVVAYNCGLLPASKITAVPVKLIREYCTPEESHHASKMYNLVAFYLKDYVLATFGLIKSDEWDANPVAVEAFTKYKEQSKNKTTTTFENCEVEWLEWGGRRRHPIAYKYNEEGAVVKHISGGSFVNIIFKNGKTLKKRIDSNGFTVQQKGKRIF